MSEYYCFKCTKERVSLGEILCHKCKINNLRAMFAALREAHANRPTRAEKAVDAAWEKGTR